MSAFEARANVSRIDTEENCCCNCKSEKKIFSICDFIKIPQL